ncbi:hypothetical protein Tco_1456839 [Tanacetum coccineum]
MGEGSAVPTNPQHTPTFIQPSPPPQKTQKPRKPKRKDTQVPQPSGPTDIVTDDVVHKELGDRLVRAATTASSLEAEGNTLQSGEDSMKLTELMELCTNLQKKVLDLEQTKTTQGNEIASLKRRVKKLEKKNRSRTHKLKRLYKIGLTARVESSGDEESLGEDASKQGRINDIDEDEDITLVNVQDDVDNEMFDADALDSEEVFVAGQNENVVKEVVDAAQVSTAATIPGTTTTTTISSQQSQDKGKGIIIEEPVKSMKKKDLIRLDEEAALKLQAEFDEEERLAREKAGKKRSQSQRLQAEEQEEMSDEEKAKLFQQLLEQIRKHFATKSAEDKRNKPPTQAQQRKIMCTYLKNMEGNKLKDLKNKSFDYIQKMFDRAFKRVNTFVDFRTNLVEGSSKRAGEELKQESTKKQKVDEDKVTVELQSLMEVIPDKEEVAIDVVPLATKPPTILYKLVKAKYGSTRLVEDMNLLLWGDLKTMFEPHVEDEIWKLQQRYKVLSWKLFDSCGVHCLSLQSGMIYMLVEKRYPLTPPTITDMLNKKLQGRIVEIKSLLNAASITAAHIRVNAAQLC